MFGNSIRKRLFVDSAFSITSFIALLAIGFWSLTNAEMSTRSVLHTDRVLVQAASLVAITPYITGANSVDRRSRGMIRDAAKKATSIALLVAYDRPEGEEAKSIASAANQTSRLLDRSLPLGPTSSMQARTRDAQRVATLAHFATLVERFAAKEYRLRASREEAELSAWRRTHVLILAIFVSIAFIIVRLHFLFGRLIVMRLKMLGKKANSFEADRVIAEPDPGFDEIARLDRSVYDMMRDIAEREGELRRLNILQDRTKDFILFIDRVDLRIIDANASARAAYGYDRDEMCRLSLPDLRAPRTLDDVPKRLADIDRGGATFETMHRRKNGSQFPVEVSAFTTDLNGRSVIMSIVRDISDRERAAVAIMRAEESDLARLKLEWEVAERKTIERRMAFSATHDELTQLPNRAFFMNRLQHMVARQKQYPNEAVAVLFLDVDRFKVTNDSLGHAVGDRLLVDIANRLRACLRAGDTLARFGGDEFTFLLERIDSEASVVAFAERVLASFNDIFVVEGCNVFASASLGIDTSKGGSKTPENVIRNADIAMYNSKARGGRCYSIFAPALLERAIVLQETESDLRHALERDEFRLFYQPIFTLDEQKLSGFEALIRWQHPYRGLLSPDQFIDIAEATGTIVPIGDWVLAQACRQLELWSANLPNARSLTVSVNVSPHQLAMPTFVNSVKSALDRSLMPAERLNIEITESAIIGLVDDVSDKLEEVRALGAKIHLDDFGTGYSSLSHLHRLPIDVLKIDRSFVSDARSGLASPEIVKTIIALASYLSIGVTAEGIETDEQLRHLRLLQCANGQGYLFSKPLSEPLCAAFIHEQARFEMKPAM